jgi:hypothetical protein
MAKTKKNYQSNYKMNEILYKKKKFLDLIIINK